MSAERAASTGGATLLLMLNLALPGIAAAADEAPDMALLEYLGSWEESDEEWVLLAETDPEDDQHTERSDPAAGGTESQESDHGN